METKTASAQASLSQTRHIFRVALHARGQTGVAVDKHTRGLMAENSQPTSTIVLVSVERGDPADPCVSEGELQAAFCPAATTSNYRQRRRSWLSDLDVEELA
jgi:hypothetical protein